MQLRTLAIAVLAISTLVPVGFGQSASNQQTWISASGKKLTATFLRLESNRVILRTAGGKEVAVPLAQLSIDSHLQALKLSNPAAFSKPIAKSAVPDAPDMEIKEVETKLLEPDVEPSELLTSPFPSNPSLEQFLDTLKNELEEESNLMAAWHALPSKTQGLVDTVVSKAMNEVGQTKLNQIRSIVKDVAIILTEKKEFILNHREYRGKLPDEIVNELWPTIAGMVTALSDKRHWQASNYSQGKVAEALAALTSQLMPYMKEMTKLSRNQGVGSSEIEYEIKSQSKDRAEVDFAIKTPQIPGIPQPPGPNSMVVKMQKYKNIWLVPSMMNQMEKGLESAIQAIDAGKMNVQSLNFVLPAVKPLTSKLAKAETQEEFDETFNAIMDLSGRR